jgi:hypothetical protein
VFRNRLDASGRCVADAWLRGPRFPPYLVLLRVGFTLPPPFLPERCALTAPFHPYHCVGQPFRLVPLQGRYVFCGTGRPRAFTPASRTLSGTLPCGVRTFLPRPPLLSQRLPAATARSSCQTLVYRESGLDSSIPSTSQSSISSSTFAIFWRNSGMSTSTVSQTIARLTAKYPCVTVPHPIKLCKRDRGVLVANAWVNLRKIVCRFSDDLDVADHGVLLECVGEELVAAHSFVY